MRRFLLWLFPDLQAELDALRSGNSKLVVENSRLLDQIYNPVDVSIAKQLVASAARNARMVNRLSKLRIEMLDVPSCAHQIAFRRKLTGAEDVIRQIVKDEEPSWPGA